MAVLPLLATDKIKSSVKGPYDGPLMRGAISYLDFYLLLSRTERPDKPGRIYTALEFWPCRHMQKIYRAIVVIFQ